MVTLPELKKNDIGVNHLWLDGVCITDIAERIVIDQEAELAQNGFAKATVTYLVRTIPETTTIRRKTLADGTVEFEAHDSTKKPDILTVKLDLDSSEIKAYIDTYVQFIKRELERQPSLIKNRT